MSRIAHRLFCCALVVGLLVPALAWLGAQEAIPAKGKDWPLFRGNALQTGVASSSLPDKLGELWTFTSGDSIESAPAVVGGVVYLPSMDEHLYALDLQTGKEKWKFKGGPFKAPPALHNGIVYLGDADGVFYAIDAATGKKKWDFKTDGEITSGANFSGDLILFGSYDETLYCLDSNGKERWKIKTQGPVNGSPAVAEGVTFVAGCDSSVHVIDVAKGKEIAAIDLGGQAAATAAVVGGHLYVGTMGNEFQAVDWKKAAIQWTFRAERRAQPFFASAAVSDKLVVVGSRDKNVWALDREGGTPVWSFPTQGRVDASPVIVGQRVYAGSLDENLYVLDLAKGNQLQKLKLDNPVTGSPAVAAGRLLVGTQKGTLYCFGAKQ